MWSVVRWTLYRLIERAAASQQSPLTHAAALCRGLLLSDSSSPEGIIRDTTLQRLPPAVGAAQTGDLHTGEHVS